MKKIYSNKHLLILLLISTIFSNIAFSQNGRIEGKIYNSITNEPIAFANVIIYGTNKATMSDENGNYSLSGINPGFVQIQVNFLGYETYVSETFQVTNANKAYAEVALKEKQIELQEVVVRASPFRRSEESPVSLRRISIEQIEKNPGGNRDVSRVIQSFPGVASTPSFRNDVIVRGGGSSENRFYLDGVEIPNLNHFATQGASGGPVGIINVDFIREVNFYSSAFPSNRGNALSSVLDFRMIDANKEKMKFRGAIGASDMALTINGPISKNTSIIASARRSYLQFLFGALGLPFLPTYNDFQFKMHTHINKKNEISFIGLGAIDVSKLNLKANKEPEQRYLLGYLPENNQWNYTLGVVYKHYADNHNDTWVLSRNMLYNQAIKYKDNIENPANKLLDYQSFEAENKFRFERNISTSGGYKINFGTNAEYDRYYNQTYRVSFGNQPDNYESNLDLFKFGLFSQITQKYLNEDLTLSLGIRTDFNTFDEKMLNPLTQISPRFSASYAITEGWYLNGNIGRYYQAPPYTALGYRNEAGALVNKENNISYISTDHYVTGLEYQPNTDSRITLEGFYKSYSNYPFSLTDSISLASKGADFGTYGDEALSSTNKGRAYGTELLFQHKKLAGADVTLSYTFVRSEFKDAFNKFIPSAWDNKHILNLLVRKEFRNNWDLGFKWRYVGGTPYTPIDFDKSSLTEAWDAKRQTYLDYSRYNTLRLKAFHQLDVRVDKSFFMDKWTLIAYIDIQNLYNFKSDAVPVYLLAEDANQKPIAPTGTPARYTLSELENSGGGTVLPTIGIIFEF